MVTITVTVRWGHRHTLHGRMSVIQRLFNAVSAALAEVCPLLSAILVTFWVLFLVSTLQHEIHEFKVASAKDCYLREEETVQYLTERCPAHQRSD